MKIKLGWIGILAAGILAFGACSTQSATFAAANDLIRLLWDVDYTTFSADETTEFAKQHYEEGFLEDYLADPDYNAGVEDVKTEELQSSVQSIEDLGTSEEDGGVVQTVRAKIHIDRFRPENPEDSFFEEGKDYVLRYEIFFQEGKIASFGFEPEGEAFLPKSEKQPLTEEQKQEIENICRDYLGLRYQIDAADFDLGKAWQRYETLCSEEFLQRDEITQEWLEEFSGQLEQADASLSLLKTDITVADQKEYLSEEDCTGFYYHAEMEYEYAAEADADWLEANGLSDTNKVKEKLYFDISGNSFKIVYAEYLE